MKIPAKRKWIIAVSFSLLALLIGLLFVLKPGKQYVQEMLLNDAMRHAIDNGNASLVTKLLQEGADPNRIGTGGLSGGTPLSWATHHSDIGIMKLLIAGGADVNKKIEGGATVLMLATSTQATQFLLDNGADPTLKDQYGQTALQHAETNNKVSIVLNISNDTHKKFVIPACAGITDAGVAHRRLSTIKLLNCFDELKRRNRKC